MTTESTLTHPATATAKELFYATVAALRALDGLEDIPSRAMSEFTLATVDALAETVRVNVGIISRLTTVWGSSPDAVLTLANAHAQL